MSKGPLLITSFRAWRSHQHSNSSQDLVAAMAANHQLPPNAVWLSQVPVNFQTAPMQVLSEIYRIRPRAVVCCGMAEKRVCLSLEQQARGRMGALKTNLNLVDLLANTRLSEVSYDAGDYVCNHLYYSVLEAIYQGKISTSCLFVHVPLLSVQTWPLIQSDLSEVLEKLAS